jgi:DNA-binding PadR family transcriptional regulator
MSLEHILLGALREPASGYDIKAQFDGVFSHFWPAELSQIYRTLRRLEEDGLLRSRQVASDRGPDRRVYQTTAKGRARLKQWLLAGPQLSDERHVFCAQTYFLDALGDDDDARIAFMRRLRDEFGARVATLEAIEAGWRAEDARYPDALPMPELVQQFTLALGLQKYGVIKRWAEQCLERLESRMPQEVT